MKKITSFIRNHKTRFIIIALLLIGYAFFWRKKTTTALPTEADTVAVQRWTIASTLQVIGSTNLVTSQKLTFGAGWRVTKINVQQWDTVKKWQILAEIDKRDADNDIQAQQLSIQSAQISYDKLLSSTKDYQITQAQVNTQNANGTVATSELELANLKIEKDLKVQEQNDLIAEKEKSLAIINAQGSTGSIQDYSAQSVSAQNDWLDSIQQWRDALRTLDDMFHTSEPFNQSLFYIGWKQDGLLWKAQTAITQLRWALDTFQTSYDTYVATTPKTLNVVLKFQNDNKIYLNAFSNTAQAASQAIVNSLTDSRYYTEAKLASDRSAVTSMNSKVISLLNSINSSIKQSQSNDTDRLTLQNDINAAKRNIDKLKLDYDIKIAQKQNDIVSSKWSAQINSENAASLLAWPTTAEKASIANQIAQAQLWLVKSKKKLEDYQIIAQFDGVVTAIDFKKWDQVTALNSGITVEVPGIYEVNVLFDQLDIVKINLWQEANIVFDAYPSETFTWVISSIDPTPQTDQWVVSYQAKIILQKWGKNIYNQMSATVDVTLEKKENVLVIPSLSITSTWDIKSVQVWKDNQLQTRDIVTGLTDWKNTEIVSWLDEWEKITKKVFKIVSKAAWFSFGPPRTWQRTPNANAGGR